MDNELSYDINSVASRHLLMILNGKTSEVTGLPNGEVLTVSRTNAEFTNTPGLRSEAHFFQSGDKSANATITVITGTVQDKIFNTLYNAQSNNPNSTKPMPTFIYYDDATGETLTMKNCMSTSLPQGTMGNSEQNLPWAYLVQEFTRDFDGLSDEIKALING